MTEDARRDTEPPGTLVPGGSAVFIDATEESGRSYSSEPLRAR